MVKIAKSNKKMIMPNAGKGIVKLALPRFIAESVNWNNHFQQQSGNVS